MFLLKSMAQAVVSSTILDSYALLIKNNNKIFQINFLKFSLLVILNYTFKKIFQYIPLHNSWLIHGILPAPQSLMPFAPENC